MNRFLRTLALAALALPPAVPARAQSPYSYGYNPYGGYYGPGASYNSYTGNYAMGRYSYNPYNGSYGVQPGRRFGGYQAIPLDYNPYVGPTSYLGALRNPYTGTYGWGYRLH